MKPLSERILMKGETKPINVTNWDMTREEISTEVTQLEAIETAARNTIAMARSFQNFPSWLEDLEKALDNEQEEKCYTLKEIKDMFFPNRDLDSLRSDVQALDIV